MRGSSSYTATTISSSLRRTDSGRCRGTLVVVCAVLSLAFLAGSVEAAANRGPEEFKSCVGKSSRGEKSAKGSVRHIEKKTMQTAKVIAASNSENRFACKNRHSVVSHKDFCLRSTSAETAGMG